eukprot:scaffold15100_cov27-Tisochrysis_lutea.AAC.6
MDNGSAKRRRLAHLGHEGDQVERVARAVVLDWHVLGSLQTAGQQACCSRARGQRIRLRGSRHARAQ